MNTQHFHSIQAREKSSELIFICCSAEGNMIVHKISINTLDTGDSSKEFLPQKNNKAKNWWLLMCQWCDSTLISFPNDLLFKWDEEQNEHCIYDSMHFEWRSTLGLIEYLPHVCKKTNATCSIEIEWALVIKPHFSSLGVFRLNKYCKFYLFLLQFDMQRLTVPTSSHEQ